MIQDIYPHYYNNRWSNDVAEAEDYIIAFFGKKVLVKLINQHNFVFPEFRQISGQISGGSKRLKYLFTIDEKRYFLLAAESQEDCGDFIWEDISFFRTGNPGYLSFAGATASQLYRWYESHIYCGHCGAKMKTGITERVLVCPECKVMEYPKICPAVIIAVTHGDKILLSKYAAGRGTSNYALLAGFVEIGETLEQTVKREVMEEVGLKVKNIRYYKSQPWSFTDTLLSGFYVDLDGEDGITMDEEELSEAVWFVRSEIPANSSSGSLTWDMIEAFRADRFPK